MWVWAMRAYRHRRWTGHHKSRRQPGAGAFYIVSATEVWVFNSLVTGDIAPRIFTFEA